MSRVLGRSLDVYKISEELKDSKIRPHNNDKNLITWDDIDTVPEKIELYLPKTAIDFLLEKKIKIYKNPFKRYTVTQIPDSKDDERSIEFPSKKPRKEFAREFAFYIGTLLSFYNDDKQPSLMSICNEYNDILGLITEYLYLREIGEEEKFSKKHLAQLRRYTSTYISDYDNYKEFSDLRSSDNIITLSNEKYDKFMKISEENDEIMESSTIDTLIQLSSFDGALQVIDRCNNPQDYQQIIEELMLNEGNDRSQILYSKGIDSYGYRRLRKELNKHVAK